MRKNFKNTTKAFLAVFLTISMIMTLMIGDSALAYITDFGSTHIFFNEEREIARGVVLNDWQGRNPDGTPKLGHTITFNPATSDAKIVSAFGNSVYGRKTLSAMSQVVEKQGVTIIGGINGDFYNLDSGVPIGIVIQDGRLVSCSPTSWNAIGFKDDGSVVIGSPKIDMKVLLGETEFHINNFNKAQGDWGPYLYSSDYGPTTGSTVPSIEVVMDIKMGGPAAGKVMLATVSEIRKDTMATPIRPNQLVFSARKDKYGEYTLSQFKVGDTLSIEFYDSTNEWTNVKQAIGGEKILINNGVITSGLATKNYNPTTAIGVKANGEVVLYQVDGRDDASQGVSSMEVAQFLYNLGCVKAIQLDGGGSSAMLARRPGYKSPGLINNPSDGRERANSNGLILVSKQSEAIKNGTAVSNPVAQKLHIYPGKTYALPNAAVQYSVLATDDYFFQTPVPSGVVWGSNAGSMDSSGKLTVNAQPGIYQVVAGGGAAVGTSELTVLTGVTSLKPSKSLVQLSPGASVDLNCEAYYNDIKVNSTDSSFTWQVEGNIGTITPDGVFTMAQGATGKGRITVKYGTVSAYIDVVAPDSPNAIEDFENGIGWGSSLVRAKSGAASVVQDANLAKSGSKLLKIDYDFTQDASVQPGVAGLYAFRIDPNTKAQMGISIDKNPSAIGMWVYGDNSKVWLRAKLKDGSGQYFDVDFTPDYRTDTKTGGVDWTGWKYVEARIPAGKQGPFTLDTPIRIMCSRDEMRTKGTLYFDQIRAVYGESSIDVQAPSVSVASPANQSVNKTGKLPLNIVISDGANGSGVDTKTIQVLLDGAAVPNLKITTNGAVTITGELGTTLPLADGIHVLTVTSQDTFGNKGTTNITFKVETGAPQMVAVTSPTVKAGGTFATNVNVMHPKNLKKVYMIFTYDPAKAEVVDADAKKAGKQIALDAWVKKGKVINQIVDEKNGKIILEIDNLTNLSSYTYSKFAVVTFKAKTALQDSANINLSVGAMIVGKNPASQRFSLPGMTVGLDKSTQASAGSQVPTGNQASAGSQITTSLVPQNLTLSLTADQTKMAVNYLTPTDGVGTIVQYSEERTYNGSFSASMAVNGKDQDVSLVNVSKTVPVRVHSATLTGLKPGTTYVYRVGDSSGNFSAVNKFTTSNDENPYSFIFVTDPQAADTAAYKVFGDVLKKAVEKAGNPAFALMGGDLADRGGNKGQWDMMFNAGAPIFSSLPVMATPGNHEYYDDSRLTNFTSLFSLPENGPEGYNETVYSFTTKDALFMVLDTQKNIAKQMQWLEQTAKASDKKWKIVMMHRGIYSGFYDEAEYRKAMAPVFDRAGIDLVLNGHDHTYLRTTMKAGNKVSPGAGTTYITGGSSAKKYYDAVKRTWTQVLYDTNNPVFTTFKVYSDRISIVSSHLENGKTVDHDSFDIIKKQ